MMMRCCMKQKQVLKIEQNEESADPDDIEDWHKV